MGDETAMPAMTVAQLRRCLENCGPRGDESVVVIPRETMADGVGVTPSIDVIAAHFGFDHDDGALFLMPAVPVAATGIEFDRERERNRALTERLGWIHYVLGSNASANEKLAEIKRIALGHGLPHDLPRAKKSDMSWFERDVAAHVGNGKGAAYRAGMSSAAAICDMVAKEIEAEGTVGRRIKRAAAEIAGAVRACGDRIWDYRAKVEAE